MGPLNSEIYSNALTSYFSTSITKYPEIAEKTDYWRFLKNLKSETKGPTSTKGLLPVTSYVRKVKRTGEKKEAQISFQRDLQHRTHLWKWRKSVWEGGNGTSMLQGQLAQLHFQGWDYYAQMIIPLLDLTSQFHHIKNHILTR